jgi:hypothetical protein
MEGTGVDPQPAVEAAILDRLLKIEDHVASIRVLMEVHAGAATQRQQDLLAAIAAAEQTNHYYGKELTKAYHRLERLYRRLEEQLRTIDDLSIAAPPEPPSN